MGCEKNLLENYPRSKRDVFGRSRDKTDQDRAIARQFGREFFDGDRRHGYGGHYYDPKFWTGVVPVIAEEYDLKPGSRILDIGCAKGFMLKDFLTYEPKLQVCGIDISKYAINNCDPMVELHLDVGDARELPFSDNSFDLVISVNTIHNLSLKDCEQALREIERVSASASFITVDAYETTIEKERMDAWNLTALTVLKKAEWIETFDLAGFSGDYSWFTP